MSKQNKWPVPYVLFVAVVLLAWLIYIISYQVPILSIFKEHFSVMITMLFGAFIAGSSPEGSASIAYPVFTLYLKIDPSVVRNFSFAIQSFGMTAASIYILSKKIQLEKNYILYVSMGGLVGLIFGTYYIVPLVSPPIAKLLFVSLWLSFGIVLFFQNRNKKRIVYDHMESLQKQDILLLLLFGIMGGIISSLFGTGINIFTFCLMVTYYHINEKVATASSIIIMTIETIIGFFLHKAILNDFNDQSFNMWISCIPIVIFMAPLGSYVMSKISRIQLANLLYCILLIQYLGAIWVIKPSLILSVLSLIVIITGVVLFNLLSHKKQSAKHNIST